MSENIYSVFLIEDEIIIRESIKSIVNWEEYGFLFAGEAPDGELAWPQIQKIRPDIVITDIKMPFMDGLAISKLIKKNFPETVIVILSGHSDFSYAQEAITLGVNKYLLKPITKDQLVDALLEIKSKKDRENRIISPQTIFEAIIKNNNSIPEILDWAESLGYSLVAESYNVLIFYIENDAANKNREKLYEFLDSENILTSNAGIDTTAILITGEKNNIADKTLQLKTIIKDLHRGKEIYVVNGDPVGRLSAVSECYNTARKRLFSVNTVNMGIDFNPDDLDAAKTERHIVERFIVNGNIQELEDFVKSYIDSFGTAMESIVFCQYVLLNIQFTVNAFLQKLDIENDSKPQINLQEALQNRKSRELFIYQLLENALLLRESTAKSRHSQSVAKAMAYIKENYRNPDIDLNAVAKFVSMSPTHLSGTFSQSVGKTFTEYLTELRMEKARELLRFSDKSSGEIAFEVGYSDPHYFSTIFKKMNNISPREYRTRGGSK